MAPGAPRPQRRQAVLVIHGIGDQRPMETLGSFVEQAIPSGLSARRWYRPDTVSDNFDLWQVVTYDEAQPEIRTDFYELYWAHLMEGTRFASVWAWIWNDLIRRRSSTMRPPMREARAWVIPVLVVYAALLLAALVGTILWSGWFGVLLAALLLLFWFASRKFLEPYVGDAARYFRNTPENIEARQKIRALGVAALDHLHEHGYERIIVVGHSLGSVVGYDVLRYAFARRTREMKLPGGALPAEIAAFDRASAEADIPAFQAAQRALCRALAQGREGREWLVTDFVTLGSPLTYAEVLMAEKPGDFETFVQRRLLPVCPPQQGPAANERAIRGFYRYCDRASGDEVASPHHAAMFAFTRWTNLYFPVRNVVFGDIIGGEVAGTDLFGTGVKDVAVDTTHLHGWRLFSHTSYWRPGGLAGSPDHIAALRAALDLDDLGTAAQLPARTHG
jgi:hypothetical protein